LIGLLAFAAQPQEWRSIAAGMEKQQMLLLMVIFWNSGAWLHCCNVQFFFLFEKSMKKV
jgi:hypothetical protein